MLFTSIQISIWLLKLIYNSTTHTHSHYAFEYLFSILSFSFAFFSFFFSSCIIHCFRLFIPFSTISKRCHTEINNTQQQQQIRSHRQKKMKPLIQRERNNKKRNYHESVNKNANKLISVFFFFVISTMKNEKALAWIQLLFSSFLLFCATHLNLIHISHSGLFH